MSIDALISHRTVQTRGACLHVAQAGPAEGALVLLLHGFPEFWYGWRHQIPALTAAGFRVWMPDQRGYNLSEKPSGIRAYSIDRLAEDVIDLIDAAGASQVYLAGHDWGAAVAWWAAARYPERVKKLAILNVPHPAVMLRTLRASPAQLLKSWYIFFFQLPWISDTLLRANNARAIETMMRGSSNPGSFSDDDFARYHEAWRQPGAVTAMLNWYRAAVRLQPEAAHDARVRVPTLILWGVRDIALTRAMASASREYCDDSQLVWFENATHWVQHDEPERVSQHLIEFFT